jgi:hypothetical protein
MTIHWSLPQGGFAHLDDVVQANLFRFHRKASIRGRV